ncbi:MAG: zinc ribbon domain-containing protein [Candidatus Weimeria sp.]|nr:zinc ribbon domain-containing protein [Lachnospiraceae bacterium]MEE3354835.1 zinc ribbon domain-containing protein [Candidatus Weimeria sp.]
MGMFDDVSDTLLKAGTDAANFVKDTASTAKLNLDLKGKENALKKAYEGLGKKYYEQHKSEGDPLFAQIRELIVDIDDLKEQIAEIRGQEVCPKCGAYVPKDAQYCNKCGAAIFPFEEDVTTED